MFIAFDFVEGVTIVDWIASKKLYVLDTTETYKETIIENLENSGTAYFLLHIVQVWRVPYASSKAILKTNS